MINNNKLLRNNYIKNIIKNIIIKNNNNNINKLDINNNSNKLLRNINKYNNKWDTNKIIYNYNNNNILNNLKNKYIIEKYISYILNYINKSQKLINQKNIGNNILSILYKKPIILFNNNVNNTTSTDKNNNLNEKSLIDIILFIYIPKINKLNNNNKIYNNGNIEIEKYNIINKVIKNISKIRLNEIINNNQIEIKIKPIILTYDYLDSDIYSKSISRYLSKNPNFDSINNILNLNNNMNIIKNYLYNKINNITIINKIDYLTSLNKLNNNNNNNNKEYNKELIINNYLLYKLIIGYNWKFKGKNYNSESNARAVRYYSNDGILNNSSIPGGNNINSQFKLNHYSANLTKSNSFIINKNGKFNINLTLSHF